MGDRISPDAAAAFMISRGLRPKVPYTNNKTPWLCECLRCGREVTPKYNYATDSRTKDPCRYCAQRAVDPGEAEAAMVAAGAQPKVAYINSKTAWLCDCLTCGREISPHYGSVRAGRRPCGYCIGRLVKPAEAEALMFSRGLRPKTPYRNSQTRWLCECMGCGREVSPMYASIQQGQGGCVYCVGNVVDPDEAAAIMTAAGLRPKVSYPGAKTPWLCECISCGLEVTPAYGNVARGQTGCSDCAVGGFKYGAPAVVYVISHPTLNAHKVGITSATATHDRLAEWRAQGWQVVKTVAFEVGAAAYKVEQAVLRWLRDELGLAAHLGRDEMPNGGHSETVCADSIDLPTIWDRVVAEVARLAC